MGLLFGPAATPQIESETERLLIGMGAVCIEPLCRVLDACYYPSDRDTCLRVLTKVHDPLLKEKMAYILEVLSRCDRDPEAGDLVDTLHALRTRTIIPMLHLLRKDAAVPPEIRAKIIRIISGMGDMAVEPIIQLFRYGDETYYESVLPILRTLAPYSSYKLKYAKCSGDMAVRESAEKAERAINPIAPWKYSKTINASKNCFLSSTDDYYGFEPSEYEFFWYENYDDLYDSWGCRN